MSRLRAASVRVPCSTSNLGSGFDVLGIALARYLEASFEPADDPLRVVREGTLEALDVSPEGDLFVAAFRSALQAGGARGVERERPLGVLTVRSSIPVARGLGSSAAAVVAGDALGRLAAGGDADPRTAYRAALAADGHGDNAGPCALGGFRAAVPGPDGARSLELPLSGGVGFAYAAPGTGVSTARAREALPRTVEHATAVEALARVTALSRGLAEGDPELIRTGVEDALHVPYRLPLVAGGEQAMAAGTDAGAWAVTISGAGSGLIAFCDPERAQEVADAMQAVFATEGPPSVGFALEPDLTGLVADPV